VNRSPTAISRALISVVALLAGCAPKCGTKQAVQLDASPGLRVTRVLTESEYHRIPWSRAPVATAYEYSSGPVRIFLSAPERATPYGLFVDSATTLDGAPIDLRGELIHPGYPGTSIRYFFTVSAGPDSGVIAAFTQQGERLTTIALRPRLRSYGWWCAIDAL